MNCFNESEGFVGSCLHVFRGLLLIDRTVAAEEAREDEVQGPGFGSEVRLEIVRDDAEHATDLEQVPTRTALDGDLALARIGSEVARDHLDEGGFPTPVRAENRHALFRIDRKVF